MALSEIKNKLYKKEADSNLSQHDKTEFDTEGITKGVSSEENKQEDQWVEEKKGFIEEQKKFIKIGAIILSVIFFIVAVNPASISSVKPPPTPPTKPPPIPPS